MYKSIDLTTGTNLAPLGWGDLLHTPSKIEHFFPHTLNKTLQRNMSVFFSINGLLLIVTAVGKVFVWIHGCCICLASKFKMWKSRSHTWLNVTNVGRLLFYRQIMWSSWWLALVYNVKTSGGSIGLMVKINFFSVYNINCVYEMYVQLL